MTRIDAAGRRLIAAMEEGEVVRRCDAGWRHGAGLVPAELVAALQRHDLVREVGARLRLTPAGIGFTARNARPEGANRLLAERSVPANGEAHCGTGRRARSVTVNLGESPLGWLKARGLVDGRQYDAGERLRGDWEMAELGPRVTMRWEMAPAARHAGGKSERPDPTTAQIAAKRRFEGALAAAGSGLGDVLWRVVCAGEGLESAEKALGWPRRAGKLVLLMALDRVADFHGLR